ncbi:MAG: 2-amino-4-hydroxy-6-hydroxymethyldihydropteridine diphosphokinase [Nitrospinaceae bacterium]|nr:MAG: 2-amino-4-hydroxy-6-hydroxymethyldihydropteridine diphosphokinase [Nitrospinaceae bacterium]
MPNSAYIGIGSNLGSPLANCQQALTHFENHPEIQVTACSSFYKTQPVGVTEQGWFVNAVAKILTDLEPLPLLELLLGIEKAMGRTRDKKWGPRIVDLDLLLYEDRIIKIPRLQIPHPEMNRRRFVLAPLSELASGTIHPVANKTIQQLLSELPENEKVIKVHTAT